MTSGSPERDLLNAVRQVAGSSPANASQRRTRFDAYIPLDRRDRLTELTDAGYVVQPRNRVRADVASGGITVSMHLMSDSRELAVAVAHVLLDFDETPEHPIDAHLPAATLPDPGRWARFVREFDSRVRSQRSHGAFKAEFDALQDDADRALTAGAWGTTLVPRDPVAETLTTLLADTSAASGRMKVTLMDAMLAPDVIVSARLLTDDTPRQVHVSRLPPAAAADAPARQA